MQQSESHHTMYVKRRDGKTLITRMSHNARQLGDDLVTLMSRQCCLQRAEFARLVECTLTEADWDALVDERMPDGRNPFMPNR